MKTKSTSKRKSVSFSSLLSISIAWSLGLIYFDLRENLINGRVEDFDFIIFWSGIAILIAWLIFIYPPLTKINHNTSLFTFPLFPLVTTVYAVIVFIAIIGWVFFESRFGHMFEIAAVIGFFFGVFYLYFSKRDVKFIKKRLLILIPFLYIAFFLATTLWLFPTLFPSAAFRYMPKSVQERLIKETIPKFKVGDSFESLDNALPTYFSDSFSDGFGNTMVQLGEFKFVIEVKCRIISRLEYTYNKNKLYAIRAIPPEEQTCP